MITASYPIYESNIIGGKLVGYAEYSGSNLVALVSIYDWEDKNRDGDLSWWERITPYPSKSKFINDAHAAHGLKTSAGTIPLENADLEAMRAIWQRDFTDLLFGLEQTALAAELILSYHGALKPLSYSADVLIERVATGEQLPQIILSDFGADLVQSAVDYYDIRDRKPEAGVDVQVRNIQAEPEFTQLDFLSAPSGTTFVTYDPLEPLASPDYVAIAISPNTNSDVFSDASGVSNTLLSAGVRDQTVQVGKSIAVSSLFPSYLWTDADGSYDITAFAIQDRTVGGGYLEVAGVRVPEATVYEFPISDLSNWRFVAANGDAVDEIGFNIIQADGDFSPRLTPGARVTTIPTDDPDPPSPTPVYPDTIDIDNGDDGDTPLEDDFAEFYAYRSGDLIGDVVLSWRVLGTGSNPASDMDFVRTSGTMTIRDGRDSARITVDFNDDFIYEPDETFKIDFDIVSGDAVFSDDDETATIVNDDTLPPWGTGTDDHGNSLGAATFVEGESWAQGFIETPGDVDWFRFDLKGDGSYLIKAYGDNDTSFLNDDSSYNAPGLKDARAFLYRSDGFLIDKLDYDGSVLFPHARDDFELDLQGQPDQTVYLSVRENGDDDVGQYFVQAQARTEPDDFAADTSTTATLGVNDPFPASHERTGDSDWFRVELEAGTTYRFMAFDEDRLTLRGSELNGSNGRYYFGWDNPRLSVHSSSGTELVATDPDGWPESSNLLELTASASGTYFLAVDSVDTFGRMYDYVSIVQEVTDAPDGVPVVLQPGPSAGVDVSFKIRAPGQVGTDDQWLRTNGDDSAALQFDLSGMPVGAAYAAVEIFLADSTASSGESADIIVDVPTNSWGEGSSLSSLGGLDFYTAIPQPRVGQWVTIEITELFNQWQSGELANNGIVLSDGEVGSSALSRFFSSDYVDNPSLRPKLVIYGRDAEAEISGTFSASLEEDAGSVSGEISISGSGTSSPSFAGAAASGSLGTLEVNTLGDQWTYTLGSGAQRLDAGDFAKDTIFLTASNGAVQKVEIDVTGLDDQPVVLGQTTWNIAPSIDELNGSVRLFDPDKDDPDPSLNEASYVNTLGTLAVSADGAWTYIVDSDQRPSVDPSIDRHTVLASDGSEIVFEFSIEPNSSDIDSDGDGVSDSTDNAIFVANSNQRDSNGDGYGNVIDADLTNDGVIDVEDLLIFRRDFGATGFEDGVDPAADADFDSNGAVDVDDLLIFRELFGEPLGPSYVDDLVV